MKNNIAIIVSGGLGSRINSDIPKQYIAVAGKTILQYCVEKFVAHPLVTDIIVVVQAEYSKIAEELMQEFAGKKRVVLTIGGTQRYDSVMAGLAMAEKLADDAHVLIHDAVRPNVDEQTISQVIDALDNFDAACPVVAVADTVMQLKEDSLPMPLNRNEIKLVQTPQGFRLDKILFAYREFLSQTNFEPTDDASIYLRYAFNPSMAITNGSINNFKITWPADIVRFEQGLMQGNWHSNT